MRDFLVAGNWKMHGSVTGNRELVAGILDGAPDAANVQLLVCPPFPYLASVADQLEGSRVALGAQNVSEHDKGAYTGEVAPSMLRDSGCRYVIVGHSERRSLYGETSEQVAAKFRSALAAGLTPILCVGETLAEREAAATESVIEEQLAAVLTTNGIEAFARAVIAYEPVWAMLAGEDAEVAGNVQILYGGSVKGDNAAGLFGMADIDGGLIGGASLKADDFLAIAAAAASLG